MYLDKPQIQWKATQWFLFISIMIFGLCIVHGFLTHNRLEVPLSEPVDERSILDRDGGVPRSEPIDEQSLLDLLNPDASEEMELGASISKKLKKVKIEPISSMYLGSSSPRIKVVEFKCKSSQARLVKMALDHVTMLANLHKLLKMENFYFYEVFSTKAKATSCEQIYLIEGFPNYASEQKHSYYTKTNGVSALHSMRHRDGNAYGVTDLKFGGSRMSHYYKCKYFCQQERAKIKKLLKEGTLETLDKDRFLGDEESSEDFSDGTQQMVVVQNPGGMMVPQSPGGMMVQPNMVTMPQAQQSVVLQQPPQQMVQVQPSTGVVMQPQTQMLQMQPHVVQPQVVPQVMQQPGQMVVQMQPVTGQEHLSAS